MRIRMYLSQAPGRGSEPQYAEQARRTGPSGPSAFEPQYPEQARRTGPAGTAGPMPKRAAAPRDPRPERAAAAASDAGPPQTPARAGRIRCSTSALAPCRACVRHPSCGFRPR